MTQDSPPVSTTVDSSLGQRLHAARAEQNLSIEDVCARLKLPVEVVAAMEADDHARLGAAVFARGRLGNYARLVGVPMAAVDAVFARLTRELPALVTARSTSRLERVAQRSARQGVYVVLTAVIFVVPLVWIANGNRLPDAPASLTALDAPLDAKRPASAPAAPAGDQRNEQPVVASMAPFPGYRSTTADPAAPISDTPRLPGVAADRAQSSAVQGPLSLHFNADTRVDVIASDGRSLEHGIIAAGSERSYPQGSTVQATIAADDALQALRDGRPIDLAPFRRANVVRFRLSSDGSPAPAGG